VVIAALIWLTGAVNAAALPLALGVYGGAIAITYRAFCNSYPHASLGWCNGVTLFRLALVCTVVAWLFAPPAFAWAIVSVATVAFALDGLDGWLARREGYVSAFGSRFDMEVDSVLALALAAHAYLGGDVTPAVILLGLPRYAFFAAQLKWPWIAGDLPPRFSRKVVCVLQIAALIVLLLPMVGASLSNIIVAATAATLIWSFWLDLRHLRGARA